MVIALVGRSEDWRVVIGCDLLQLLPKHLINRESTVTAASLGPFLAPSMLSEQARIQQVINIPVPFNHLRTAPKWAWDATVVHVPDSSQYGVASLLWSLDELPDSGEVIHRVRNAARTKTTVPVGVYLTPFLKAAEAGSLFSGCPLVVIAGWRLQVLSTVGRHPLIGRRDQF